MTITLTVHPWHGETVGVLRSYGDEKVYIERQDGDRRLIPAAWTSLAPRVRCPLVEGQRVRIDPEAALELVRWVEPRLMRKEEGE